jgi:F0F1-type ATP synthase assembly protein I
MTHFRYNKRSTNKPLHKLDKTTTKLTNAELDLIAKRYKADMASLLIDLVAIITVGAIAGVLPDDRFPSGQLL